METNQVAAKKSDKIKLDFKDSKYADEVERVLYNNILNDHE